MLRLTTSRRETTAALLLAAYVPAATGCTSWQAQTGSVEAVFAAAPKSTTQAVAPPMPGSVASPASVVPSFESVRVSTRKTGQRELSAPRIANDTLYGRPSSDAPEIAIPVAEITFIEVRKVSADKTLGLIFGIAGSVALIAGTVALANRDAPAPPPDPSGGEDPLLSLDLLLGRHGLAPGLRHLWWRHHAGPPAYRRRQPPVRHGAGRHRSPAARRRTAGNRVRRRAGACGGGSSCQRDGGARRVRQRRAAHTACTGGPTGGAQHRWRRRSCRHPERDEQFWASAPSDPRRR